MLNNKMMAVAMTILETMMKVFPQEHLDFIFCGLLAPGDVVEMVMLDLIKRTYDKTESIKNSVLLFMRITRKALFQKRILRHFLLSMKKR